MYFSLIPDLQYDTKPISYPFSESDYVTTKNFFRRYQINPDLFDYAVFYKKYSVQDGEKIEEIANQYYGDPFYDWVIVLSNNFVNPQFAFPLEPTVLRQFVEEKYGEVQAYSGIHHYETLELKSNQTIDKSQVTILNAGVVVDQYFYTNYFSYWDGSEIKSVAGNTVSKPVTNYEHEYNENEKKRDIYILREPYFGRFIEEFKTKNLYSVSSNFISSRLKQTGWTFLIKKLAENFSPRQ